MKTNKIFATAARQEILDNAGIKYKIDQSLNFYFENDADKKKSYENLEGHIRIMKSKNRLTNFEAVKEFLSELDIDAL